ncbi:MAG: hypothetical protein KDC10_03375 [Calditrichaeota bacterium]|nr:hypothetical protein [Candidatus Cloacimonadota bacterium]MCA9787138.1 hypothetical protein [Candidatus Cloacimonadota bacterium]MCB1046219.1 hypothetical protein [Calditrichota bacterium]MCB9474234.1 hypothetical protein [Candidatus Delongbacteria bacterium]
MRSALALAFGSVLLVGPTLQASNQFLGGNSLANTHSAEILDPGRLVFSVHSRAWAKSIAGFNYSNVSQAVAINFGFSRHTELELIPILYQDLNLVNAVYNVPDDFYMRVKFGGYRMNLFNQPLKWGLHTGVRVNSSRFSNIYLEPYNGGANELMFGSMFSWYKNQLYPQEGLSAHFNLGYINHNDGNSESAVSIFSGVTHELEYSFAARYPTQKWVFAGELFGNIFLSEPAPIMYSRGDALFLKPTARYRLFQGVTLGAGLDLRIFESGPSLFIQSEGPVPPGREKAEVRINSDFPEFYPPWRLNFNLQVEASTPFSRFDTFGSVRSGSQRDWEMRKQTGLTQKEVIDWLGSDAQSADFIDLELEKIRAERRKAEADLQKLKEKMEKEGGDK